ncbi:hypothetical protein C2S51_034096 [Perilla frutescens var. frutescens]|nr:hypothetical protein C2S51_034096 [Perilla frutescens var. frutescens]
MKLEAFVLVALMTSLCLAAPRRALVSIGRNDVVAEKTKNEQASFPDGTIENHHNIPRQYYNQWGSGSSGGDNNGDNSGNGNGNGGG